MQQIILRYKRIIRCTQINKPIPLSTFPKQHSGGVEGIGDHGGSTVGHKIGFCDHPDISDLFEDRVAGDEVPEIKPFLRRCFGVEVNDVTVRRMVESLKRTFEHGTVTGGAGD